MDIMGVKEVSWTLVVVNDEVGTAICWAATKWETLPRWPGGGLDRRHTGKRTNGKVTTILRRRFFPMKDEDFSNDRLVVIVSFRKPTVLTGCWGMLVPVTWE